MKNNNLTKVLFLIIFLIICLVISFYWKSRPSKTTNKNYVFGYGSLASIYIQKVISPRGPSPIKATLRKEYGYSRHWVDSKTGGVSLTLLPSETPKEVFGVLVEYSDEDLKRCDHYEIHETNHVRVELDWKFIDCEEKFVGSKLYIYVINDNNLQKVDIVNKMPNLYAQTVMEGFLRFGEDYLRLFLENTS